MQPVVLITGAAGGLGRALAQRFHQGNWRVVVTDQNAAGLAQLGYEMPLAGCITADLRTAAACRDVVERTLGRVGRLDALVNAAGIWREGRWTNSAKRITTCSWRSTSKRRSSCARRPSRT